MSRPDALQVAEYWVSLIEVLIFDGLLVFYDAMKLFGVIWSSD